MSDNKISRAARIAAKQQADAKLFAPVTRTERYMLAQMRRLWAAIPSEQTAQVAEPTSGNWIDAEDVQHLARELDVAMNGEAGAAPQPSLCDVVSQAIERLQQTTDPLFYFRPRSDGHYEGPIHRDSIERVRIESGAWKPLYAGQPANCAELQRGKVELSEELVDRLYRGYALYQDGVTPAGLRRIIKAVSPYIEAAANAKKLARPTLEQCCNMALSHGCAPAFTTREDLYRFCLDLLAVASQGADADHEGGEA